MEKTSSVKESDILPVFQAFLLERKLVPEKNALYYAVWASKFLNYARKKQISPEKYQEKTVTEFIETLKSDTRLSDWQIRQAADAINLYYFHFRGHKPHNMSKVKSCDFRSNLLQEAQRLIRLKHYSYSTERTYLQWIDRFINYARQTGKKEASEELGAEDCQNFLSHLALKMKVSSSTQNQAFNAILFLFRNVLCRELSDLKKTVRAKRGQRLPVVFTPDEVNDNRTHVLLWSCSIRTASSQI
jgi:hypothetical protein